MNQGSENHGTHCCAWYWAYLFDHPLRRLVQKQEKIVGPYLGSGMTALDLGAGMGYFTLAMAEMVGPDGKVVAVDVQEKMLEIIMKRAGKRGLQDRIRPVLAEGGGFQVNAPADFALAMWMVHEVKDQTGFLARVYGSLKPAARFLIAEPKLHVSAASLEKTIEKAKQAGFELEARPRVGLSRAALFRKPGPG